MLLFIWAFRFVFHFLVLSMLDGCGGWSKCRLSFTFMGVFKCRGWRMEGMVMLLMLGFLKFLMVVLCGITGLWR